MYIPSQLEKSLKKMSNTQIQLIKFLLKNNVTNLAVLSINQDIFLDIYLATYI